MRRIQRNYSMDRPFRNGPKRVGRTSGADIAQDEAMPGLQMPSFGGAVLVANLLFGSIGFVAFVYGKRMNVWRPMFLGLALMAYTYFIENTLLLYGIGAGLTAALFLFRD
jgi:hypothetical protein